MATEADTIQSEPCVVEFYTTAALEGGQVIQLPSGRAGVVLRDKAATSTASPASVATEGIFDVTKASSVVILDGAPVFWDHSANAATFRRGNDRDFFLGTAVGDTTSAATVIRVNLNVRPHYDVSLAGGFRSLVVLTSGTPRLLPNGEGLQATFSATAEAQKIDALSNEGFAVGANAIIDGRITIVDGGDNAALDINIGVASGTHATDADSIANSLFLHFDGNSTNINVESDDGTTEVAATDTTLDYTAGTQIDFTIDMRDPADVQVYVNGALVLGATTFVLTAATDPLRLLFHMEKTSDDTTANVAVDFLRARLGE